MEISESQTIKQIDSCPHTSFKWNLLFWGNAIENNFLCKTQKPQLRNNNKSLQNQKILSNPSTTKADKNQSLEQVDTDPNSQIFSLPQLLLPNFFFQIGYSRSVVVESVIDNVLCSTHMRNSEFCNHDCFSKKLLLVPSMLQTKNNTNESAEY